METQNTRVERRSDCTSWEDQNDASHQLPLPTKQDAREREREYSPEAFSIQASTALLLTSVLSTAFARLAMTYSLDEREMSTAFISRASPSLIVVNWSWESLSVCDKRSSENRK